MQKHEYEAIQEYIRQARIERSVYLAGLIADGIVNAWNGAKTLAMTILLAGKAKRSQANVFTFDA